MDQKKLAAVGGGAAEQLLRITEILRLYARSAGRFHHLNDRAFPLAAVSLEALGRG